MRSQEIVAPAGEGSKPSLAPILAPRSVAVIGASRDKESIGYSILHNLILSEFDGSIYPVNPKARVIHSLRCYPSVSAIPDPVDLAVIVVNKRLVRTVMEECLKHGVRGFVVITAGFRETGEAGAASERELVELVRNAGVRMIGPNCMGVINTDPAVGLNATFAPVPARRGSIGFVSQSGALGVAILNEAAARGIGITQFVSMGNKADVSANDLIEYWEHDDATRVIALYLESFGNPRRFTQIAKRVGRRKPILLVKSGRTEAGARAAASHTGALAGTDITISAFLAQCGVVRANSIDELFDLSRAFDRCPLPAGNRVAIVTNAGGPGIMATDACVNLGLAMAELSPGTVAGLRSFLPEEASTGNPVDMIASADTPQYRRAVEAVLHDPGVDMVMVIHVTPRPRQPRELLDAVNEAAAVVPDKPVVSVMMATEDFHQEIREAEGVPVYHFPESAAQALFGLNRYGSWRARPVEEKPVRFPVDREQAAALLGEVAEGYLSQDAAFRVLEAYGIPAARWCSAGTPREAAVAAEKLGYPVVIKAMSSDLVHKSDVGGVAVDIRTPAELSEAVDRISRQMKEAGHRLDGFLLQELARGGHEVIFGVSTDPRFGPLLMFGLGGKYVEVFQDVQFAVTPLSRPEAEQLIRGLRGHKLLEGVRGEPPVDREFLAEILLRLEQLVTDHPRIQELDINPFLAAADRNGAKALDVRIRVAG